MQLYKPGQTSIASGPVWAYTSPKDPTRKLSPASLTHQPLSHNFTAMLTDCEPGTLCVNESAGLYSKQVQSFDLAWRALRGVR